MIKVGSKVKIVKPSEEDEKQYIGSDYWSSDCWEVVEKYEGEKGTITSYSEDEELFEVEFENGDWVDFYPFELEELDEN